MIKYIYILFTFITIQVNAQITAEDFSSIDFEKLKNSYALIWVDGSIGSVMDKIIMNNKYDLALTILKDSDKMHKLSIDDCSSAYKQENKDISFKYEPGMFILEEHNRLAKKYSDAVFEIIDDLAVDYDSFDYSKLQDFEMKLISAHLKKPENSYYTEVEKRNILQNLVKAGKYNYAYDLAIKYYNGFKSSWSDGIVGIQYEQSRLLFKLSYDHTKKKHAAFMYAAMCDQATGGDYDWEQASIYFPLGDTASKSVLRYLGEYHLFGIGSIPKDESLAKEYFKRAAKKGDTKSEVYLQILKQMKDEIELKRSAVTPDGDSLLFEINFKDGDYSANKVTIGDSWGYTLDYSLPKGFSGQFFPYKPKDDIGKLLFVDYDNYSSCELKEGKGTHKVSIASKIKYRGIGYLYISATFKGEASFTLFKVPMAVAWE